MHDALRMYFDGEKYAGLILAGVAMAAMLTAFLLFRAGELRSLAMTLAVVALAEIALGVGLYVRTDPQVRRLEAYLQADEPNFYRAETARMARVQRNFVLVEYAELFVIVTTALVAVWMKARPSPSGVALGLLINAAILLTFDVLAERRGAQYLAMLTDHALKSLPQSYSPGD